MSKLLDLLGKQLLFFDGATGTQLQARGLKPGEIPEFWNFTHPEIVEAVHNEYGTGHYEGGALGDTGMEVSGSEEVVRCDYHDYSNGGWHYVLRYTG